MPEYLAPGVYVEETSFRSKSIEGVSTSTAGFIGPTRTGPVSGDPELLVSFADFQRIYGGLDDLRYGGAPQTNYLAHAVRAFFEEGGRRLYVSRVFRYGDGFASNPAGVPAHHGSLSNVDNSAEVGFDYFPQMNELTLVARFPGAAGNLRVTFMLRAGSNALFGRSATAFLTRVQEFDVIHVRRRSDAGDDWTPGPIGDGTVLDGLFVARRNATLGAWELHGNAGAPVLLDALHAGFAPNTGFVEVRPITVVVEVERPLAKVENGREFESPEAIGEFGFRVGATSNLTETFTLRPPTRFARLTVPFAIIRPPGTTEANDDDARDVAALALARDLLGDRAIASLLEDEFRPSFTRDDRAALTDQRRVVYSLTGGDDGDLPTDVEYSGDEIQFSDFINDRLEMPKNGLLAFEGIEGISIVAAPGHTADGPNDDEVFAIQNAVVGHCERMRYRVAVLDTRRDYLVSQALAFRNQKSSTHAAIYYPWVTVANPLGEGRLNLPPSGFVAGIWARNDIDNAVFKAPANEVVRTAIDFEQRLSKAHQEVLNPQGVNCFRFFPGRGLLLWGARTISDDPEWKYVNVRRYFAYLEHSIDRGTQWVVFENNSDQLWGNVRRTVEDFLFNEWKMGGLLGTKPEEAFFVRCDRSTMTQNDLDNGRLVCLIGVAPVKPAEFVIFRIGQFTASANR
jgi:uncharacterized protein